MEKISNVLLSKSIYSLSGQDVLTTINYMLEEEYMQTNHFADPVEFESLLNYLYEHIDLDWMDEIERGIDNYLAQN